MNTKGRNKEELRIGGEIMENRKQINQEMTKGNQGIIKV